MRLSLQFLLAGIASGFASALYLYINYEPILLQLPAHAAIFMAGYFLLRRFLHIAKFGSKDWKPLSIYLVGALPLHLTMHVMLIKDICCS